MRRVQLPSIAVLVLLVAACAPPTSDVVDRDLLSHLPKHDEQLAVLCARGRDDAVTQAFCAGDGEPSVASITDLQALLGLSFPEDVSASSPAYSLVAHSSALPSRSVSAMNPGSVIVSLPPSDLPLNGTPGPRREDGNVVSMAFARGDEVVELAVTPRDAEPGDITFYLLRYEKECSETTRGCNNAELLTEEAERGWTKWSLYDDSDLENSVFDCLHCHQPDGPGTRRIHRMQELENPWTHWVAPFTLSGRVLLDDIVAVNPDESSIAGIPRAHLFKSDPVAVEDLVRFSASEQPNLFDAPAIEREVMESNAAQPRDNSTPGESATWQLAYDASVRGEAIPPPYHDVKVTDANKLAAMADALKRYRAGALDADALPDLREVFADHALAGMSHRAKPGLDGRALLVQACAQCHNGKLGRDADPSVTRARFDATNLDGMTQEVKDRAIERLLLPRNDRFAMPPRLFRDLNDDEIARAIDALR